MSMSGPLEQLENDLGKLREDMEMALSGSPLNRKSQKESLYGRMDAVEGDVSDLKTAAKKTEDKQKEDAARVEKYRAGIIIGAAITAFGYILTRILGGA